MSKLQFKHQCKESIAVLHFWPTQLKVIALGFTGFTLEVLWSKLWLRNFLN